MHTCVGKLTSIGADNGLSPGRRQAIIWTNAGLLLIGPLRTNFSEILMEFLAFSFRKMRLKVLSAKRRPFCLGLNVLKCYKKHFAGVLYPKVCGGGEAQMIRLVIIFMLQICCWEMKYVKVSVGFPSQRDSNSKIAPIYWHHHGVATFQKDWTGIFISIAHQFNSKWDLTANMNIYVIFTQLLKKNSHSNHEHISLSLYI